MPIVVRLLSLLVPLLLLVSGCSGGEPRRGHLVVGVTSDLRVGVDVLRLHVIRKINGAVVRDEELFSDGASPFQIPLEIGFSDLEDGDDVDVEIEAFGGTSLPLVVRTAGSTIRAGRTLLLRVDLAAACAGSMAPSCEAPQTCTGGVCGASYVNPAMLEDYNAGWSKGKADICKPNDGPPTLFVGKGQADYLPTSDYELAQIEAGPQGGHHIWIALRMKNLRQSGSITTLTGHVDELDLDINPFTVIFTFDPDEGGFCKLYGLRFQIDGGTDIEQLLGKTLLVKASVKDKDGDVGTAERWVKLSSDIL
ncbi:hypothetical protein [Polyangium fumosum]|uniref:Uncharacterized protein n=1 Tax=Polyangium fumosum TaxID=889272 RepID=A0A4U1JFR7_9BACT|nr:hypothetical protein [Polyangium fumosum]TKD08889.1 hypothetical protein E8A74_13955 [Polyangium fumosum]